MIRLALALILLVSSGSGFADAPDSELRIVKAGTLTLKVPASWEQVEAKSQRRAAQFSIAGAGEDVAELTVFHFGGPTGGVRANAVRWIGQFNENDRTITMTQGKCDAGRFIIVDATGTWNKPDGPPFARKTISTPRSRVVNVVVIEESDGATDYYFIKLSGEKDLVGKQTDALRKAIAVDSETEKPFELKDAEN